MSLKRDQAFLILPIIKSIFFLLGLDAEKKTDIEYTAVLLVLHITCGDSQFLNLLFQNASELSVT